MQLHVDLTADLGPVNDIWTFGGNTCHAPLLLRDDLNRHLSMVKKKLRFRYVRCHGMLSDGMNVVVGPRQYDFTRVDQALENILSQGMKPFLELSAMPKSLASTNRAVCYYQFHSSPPKEWGDWHHLIRSLVEHLRDKFGAQELRKWYFEVWNEPDIDFWTGTQQEYFKLYDLAARAVKEVDPRFRVGGPATARTKWIDEFLEHIAKPSDDFGLKCKRCDFISTHAYPSDLEFCEGTLGDVQLQNSNIMLTLYKEVRRKVDAALGSKFPVICGEWNSSAGPFVTNHDDCNNAAYVAKTAIELSDVCQGSLYWNISDIYEEGGFHYQPFHGGYGLLTVNDIQKSSFHAFSMLAAHKGKRIGVRLSQAAEGLGALATRSGDKLVLTIYYYREPQGNPEPVRLSLGGLSAGSGGSITSVLPGQGSAYETYIQMGKPMFANAQVISELKAASTLAKEAFQSGQEITIQPGTLVQVAIELPEA